MTDQRADIFSVPDHVQFWNFKQQVVADARPAGPFDGYSMAEWRFMPLLHQFAIFKVVEFRGFASSKCDPNLFRNMKDAELTRALSLWRPCRGSVPDEFLESGDFHAAIIEKFGSLLAVAALLAEQYWFHSKGRGLHPLNSRVLVKPSVEHATVFLAWDTQRRLVLLEDCRKAWEFHFDSVGAISNQITLWAGTMLDQIQTWQV